MTGEPHSPKPKMNETDLLRRYVAGDARAFAEIVDRHSASLVRLATRISGDAVLAQDVVQETFLRLVRLAPSLPRVRSLGAWLIEVCGNLARDALKSASRRRRRHENAARPETVPGSDGAPERDETRAAIEAAIGELPARQRQALVLRIWDGLRYREIADALRVSEGEVSYLLHHGLERLARVLVAAGRVN